MLTKGCINKVRKQQIRRKYLQHYVPVERLGVKIYMENSYKSNYP